MLWLQRPTPPRWQTVTFKSPAQAKLNGAAVSSRSHVGVNRSTCHSGTTTTFNLAPTIPRRSSCWAGVPQLKLTSAHCSMASAIADDGRTMADAANLLGRLGQLQWFVLSLFAWRSHGCQRCALREAAQMAVVREIPRTTSSPSSSTIILNEVELVPAWQGA